MTRVVLATRNDAKLTELRRLLSGVEVLGLGDVPSYPEEPETGATFAENAVAKARAAVRETGLPAIADDSGLAVDALNGMPGVLSARWSGTTGTRTEVDEANLRLVLAQTADVPAERRGAAFVCAAALVVPGGGSRVWQGELRGRLLAAPRGSGGFGYDPVFVPDGYEQTTAEMTPEEKDAISHRGQAMRALAAELPELLAP